MKTDDIHDKIQEMSVTRETRELAGLLEAVNANVGRLETQVARTLPHKHCHECGRVMTPEECGDVFPQELCCDQCAGVSDPPAEPSSARPANSNKLYSVIRVRFPSQSLDFVAVIRSKSEEETFISRVEADGGVIRMMIPAEDAGEGIYLIKPIKEQSGGRRIELDWDEMLQNFEDQANDGQCIPPDEFVKDMLATLREWKKAYDKGDCQ